MSDNAFITRLSDALQAHREATLLLQELAGELLDHTQRVRELADRLEAAPAVRATLVQSQSYEAPMDVRNMPLVLRGGPQLREG
jgi:hypothetical protein